MPSHRLSSNCHDRLYIMDTLQIICSLWDVRSFLGVFPSDLLPHSITLSGIVIINADPYTQKLSHWLAVHFRPRSYSYFDFYGLPRLFQLSNLSFDTIAPSGITTRYSCRVLLEPSAANTVVCKPCTWIEVTIRSNSSASDKQTSKMFQPEFGRLRRVPRGGQYSQSMHKRYCTIITAIISYLYSYEGDID